MPRQIAPRTALILACAAPAAAFAPGGAARALPPLLATEDPSRTASYLKKLAPAPETALRAEVLRRKLEGRLSVKEENAYLATLESTGALATARSTPRAPDDAEYLDELDRSTWASTLFKKELARRGVGAAAGEVEYLEGLDAGGEPEESSPLAWRGAMLFVTVAWATNFALTAFACEDLGAAAGLDGSTAALVFVALRFFVASASTAPFLADASPGVLASGAKIGGLCAFGYFAQAAALSLGFPAANAAFICSLQAVVVALLARGGVARRTWLGVALAVSGVACLELGGPAVTDAASPVAFLLALGQPVGFGLSYLALEDAVEEHPDDAVALSAIQCVVIFGGAAAALGAALGAPDAVADVSSALSTMSPAVAGTLAWCGLVSTSFTIWLQAEAFKRLPVIDSSLILTSEPLWAALVAAGLLGDTFSRGDVAGGLLILGACAVNDGLVPLPDFLDEPELA